MRDSKVRWVFCRTNMNGYLLTLMILKELNERRQNSRPAQRCFPAMNYQSSAVICGDALCAANVAIFNDPPDPIPPNLH